MKSLLAVFVLVAVTLSSSFAQESFLDKLQKFAGEADTIGQLRGSRYLVIGEGMVAFQDGSQQKGNIEFEITVRSSDMSYIMFTPENEMQAKAIGENKIEYFKVNGHTFYPVKLKMDDLAIGNKRIFAEMLHTDANDPFKMYLLRMVAVKSPEFRQNGAFELSRSFYVQLPEFKVAHGLEDITFTPFAKKMSNYLKDCPELAEKIKNKEEGYKYNMFKGAANNAVFYRIMDEYNACKTK